MDVSEEPQTETIARDDHNEIYKFLAHHGISQKTRDLFSSLLIVTIFNLIKTS